MTRTELIIGLLDFHIEKRKCKYLTAIEGGKILDRAGVLNDSRQRLGKPLRDLLRAGLLPHAYQEGVRWRIPHSESNPNQ